MMDFCYQMGWVFQQTFHNYHLEVKIRGKDQIFFGIKQAFIIIIPVIVTVGVKFMHT